ncbi:MAG: hypothetical protein U5R30_18445 [Deltaproteobacteria bacterium]|nr:hypothetical protein [Deltaproteobacteria bacterium]
MRFGVFFRYRFYTQINTSTSKPTRNASDTYEKLYTQSPTIARHFIYQEKGNILGHMAMVRFYEEAWLIHHHAARKSALNKAGLIVLKQISHFINDSCRLNAIHLKYVIMYYRPNNPISQSGFRWCLPADR